jgi:hypothetical protein
MGNTNSTTQTQQARNGYSDLERDNPNIRSQHEQWQRQRSERGEDVNDYNAFRSHVKDIGSPDPGEREFEEFRSDRSSSMGSNERQTVGAAGRS